MLLTASSILFIACHVHVAVHSTMLHIDLCKRVNERNSMRISTLKLQQMYDSGWLQDVAPDMM